MLGRNARFTVDNRYTGGSVDNCGVPLTPALAGRQLLVGLFASGVCLTLPQSKEGYDAD